jgi:WD40 repeat protein
LCYIPDNQLLLCGGARGDLAVFDMRQRVIMTTIENHHSDGVRGISVHPSGRFFVTGATDGYVKVSLMLNTLRVWGKTLYIFVNSCILILLHCIPNLSLLIIFIFFIEYHFKVWSLPGFEVTNTLANIHPKRTVVGTNAFLGGQLHESVISHYGVTDLIINEKYLLTCGSDGTVKYTPLV